MEQVQLSNDEKLELKDRIVEKLRQLGAYIDDELPSYIGVLVANNRTKDHILTDMGLFLNDNAAEFTNWLESAVLSFRKPEGGEEMSLRADHNFSSASEDDEPRPRITSVVMPAEDNHRGRRRSDNGRSRSPRRRGMRSDDWEDRMRRNRDRPPRRSRSPPRRRASRESRDSLDSKRARLLLRAVEDSKMSTDGTSTEKRSVMSRLGNTASVRQRLGRTSEDKDVVDSSMDDSPDDSTGDRPTARKGSVLSRLGPKKASEPHSSTTIIVQQVAPTTSKCTAFPKCKFGKKCRFFHPKTKCRFGFRCTNRVCNYVHPTPPSKPAHNGVLCKYFPNCTKPNCTFFHPIACKFGAKCTNSTCPFFHAEKSATAAATGSNSETIACRFGDKCTRKATCKFKHTEPGEATGDVVDASAEDSTGADANPTGEEAATTTDAAVEAQN